MAEEDLIDEEPEAQRIRGRINGSIIARVGFGEKVFMSMFLGMGAIIVGLLSFICFQVYDGNRENGELSVAFREYANATNRRLDTLERLVLERD